MALLHASSLFLLSYHKSLETPCSAKLPFLTTQSTKLALVNKAKGKSLKIKAAVIENLHEDEVLLPKEPEEASEQERETYDWKEEWYPLYITAEVPDDAAIGLNVYDKQVVLYKDAAGVIHCHEDRCPHRLAKLSEGQLVNGTLECLYHGWQFDGNGKCVHIPQLPEGAKIPQNACVKTYEVRDSQGVIWVWMSDKNPPDLTKLPYFDMYDRPDFKDLSTIHELPYDHSILLENLMDPAHVPISHDRTDWTAKREDAQALAFKVTERNGRGFVGQWWRTKNPNLVNTLQFQAPCVLSNAVEFTDKKGVKQCFQALFLCRPAGQGKSMLLVRFGRTSSSALINLLPKWFFHQNQGKVFEQDMGFLSSQNEVLMKEKVPTKELYLNLKSSDTWVMEYRKWMDKVGHGMPYYFGHKSISLPKEPAVVEQAPAGVVAGISASFPAKGGIGTQHAPNPANRYYRHVVHCKGCRNSVKTFQTWKNGLLALAAAALASAVLATAKRSKVVMLVSAVLLLGGSFVCSSIVNVITTNFVRTHRRL